MNATQALTRLRKLLGKDAAIQDHKRDSSPELREQQRAAHQEAARLDREAHDALEARRLAVLAADAEYQSLLVARQQARKTLDATPWPSYRYHAGRISSAAGLRMFHLDAEADTLAELVEKVEAEKAKVRA